MKKNTKKREKKHEKNTKNHDFSLVFSRFFARLGLLFDAKMGLQKGFYFFRTPKIRGSIFRVVKIRAIIRVFGLK